MNRKNNNVEIKVTMSLQRNYLGSSLNNTSVQFFGVLDGLIPQSWTGGPPMFTLTGNTNFALTTAMSGSTVITSPNANITLTLPPQPVSQCNYQIITGSNVNTCNIVSSNGNAIQGCLNSNGAIIAVANANAILVNTASKLGDSINFVSDGTRWFVRGLAQGAVAYTVS